MAASLARWLLAVALLPLPSSSLQPAISTRTGASAAPPGLVPQTRPELSHEVDRAETGSLEVEPVPQDAPSWMPAAACIAVLLLLALLIAFVQGDYWADYLEQVGTPRGSTREEAFEHWIVIAKTNNLDFYTCMGISLGMNELTGQKEGKFAKPLAVLIVMQGILPLLLVIYQIRDFQAYSHYQDMSFRLIGFILFIFSVVHLYRGALDECRMAFLDLALRYHCVSWQFLWPMILGEVLNAFSAYALVVTLYLVFCHVDNTPELLVHCLALNFIVTVDNDLVDEDLRYFSIDKLRLAFKSSSVMEHHKKGYFQHFVLKLTQHICAVLRNMATLCIGSMLAFIFFFSHQDMWCRLLGSYSSWPFCSGLH